MKHKFLAGPFAVVNSVTGVDLSDLNARSLKGARFTLPFPLQTRHSP
jgi:hypothetical protein